MTVKELKEELEKFDENQLIGGAGHFGEYLPIDYIEVHHSQKFVHIYIEWAGNAPE